jgi:NADH-quinone oxidoreductase subunit G
MIQLIGTNPREEAPVLNARIRAAWARGADIGLIGEPVDLTYEYAHIGTDRDALVKLASKKIPAKTRDAKNTLVIVGQGALQEADGEAVLSQAMQLAENTGSKLMILHTAASRVGAMDIGAVTEGGLDAALDGAQVIYNLGADEVEITGEAFVIYQGSHGDLGAHQADVIFPSAAYTEESGLFVNTEGRPQMAARASFPPGDAKENWAILRALSAELEATLGYSTLAGLRTALVEAVPHLLDIDVVADNAWTPIELRAPGKASLRYTVKDFYLTNPIARASVLMSELSAAAKERADTAVAAE